MRDLKAGNGAVIDLAITEADFRRVQGIGELANKFVELEMDREQIHAVHHTVEAFRFPSAGRSGLQALARGFEEELIAIFTRAETFADVIKELKLSSKDFDRPSLEISECDEAKREFLSLANWLIDLEAGRSAS